MRSARSSTGSYVDREMIDKLIVRNALRILDLSKFIYGGTCPMCGHEKSFILWSHTGNYRCFWCGCDGRFVRAPEREIEEKRQLEAKLAATE